MKSFLIEIGSEEIPARFISVGLAALRQDITGLLKSQNLSFGNITESATPRRLCLFIEDIEEKQEDRTIETFGPPIKAAYDSSGAPTKAATGFARSLNIEVTDLKVKTTERGDYVYAIVESKGRLTSDILQESLPGLIASLKLPKTMRWGDGPLRYFRPLQWILAIYGGEPLIFTLENITSSDISYGHRFLSPAAFKVENPSEYAETLKKHSIITDIKERKSIIQNEIKQIENEQGCSAIMDEELLDTVTNLVEYPVVVHGRFEDKYLELPRELLVTVMKSHQKYFSTEDKNGSMNSSFLVISNTKRENSITVARGAERVLRARLEDARFYFHEDRKKPFGDYIEDLKSVTFQEKLGSVYDKAERIEKISSFIAEKAKLQNQDNIKRASFLCKADLVTGVVGEFPELQGYIGMIYANTSGEAKEVADAVYDHYKPGFAGDTLPASETGKIISLADKIDNIAAFFSIGLIPTGSEDPYALRRQAAGIIHILQDSEIELTLADLTAKALEVLKVNDDENRTLAEKIHQFFIQRLSGIYASQGFSHDVVNAVLAADSLTLRTISERLQVLAKLKTDAAFPAMITAAKRVYNILAKLEHAEVSSSLFNDETEKVLFDVSTEINMKLKKSEYRALLDFEKPINAFFEAVLVMDKEPSIRANRLALLSHVKDTFNRLADFSQIEEQ